MPRKPEHRRPPEDDAFSLENIAQRAKEHILQQGWHSPTLLVKGSKDQLNGQFDQLPPTHEGRVHLMYTTGQSFGAQDTLGMLQHIVFITESWVSILAQGKPVRRPSQDPARQEVLSIAHLDVPHQQQSLILYKIVRDTDDRIIALPDFNVVKEETRIDSPLLKAFVVGYMGSRAQKYN